MKKILLILSAIFLLFVGCKKDDVIEASKLEIKNGIVERGWDFLKLSGVYSYPQELVGIKLYLSESSNMSGAKSYNCVLEGREFACEAADLKDGMKYYYYLEYDNGYEKIKNKVDFVSTVAKPVLTTENAVNITITSAVLSGSVTNSDAANEIKTKGFCWGTSQNPGIESNVTTNGSGVGSYTSNIDNLSPNTTYFYRTYLTTNYGTIYGEQKNFKTVEVTLPTVTTDEITEITSNSAQCGANVTSDGNGTVRARGVCWSASPNPTISDNDGMTTDGEGAGIFTSNLTNLNENTTYYVRAYATNSAGTGYGEEKTFKTVGCINGHEYVDLGLPSGLKWATCNVGADTPEDYGDYFAWGETSSKAEYTYENSITYGLTRSELQSQGYIDGSGNLTPLHDAATANWGGSWRMPTKEEMQELVDHCEWEWTEVNGVNGSRVIGPNGSYIFLPAAGRRHGTSLDYGGGYGYYWSSTPFDDYDDYYAYRLYFYNGYENVNDYSRYLGLTVRPITE